MKILRRILLWSICAVWALSFLLVVWATGSMFPARPTEAHDLDDLIFWAALNAWIYLPPLLFLVWWLIKRLSKGLVRAQN